MFYWLSRTISISTSILPWKDRLRKEVSASSQIIHGANSQELFLAKKIDTTSLIKYTGTTSINNADIYYSDNPSDLIRSFLIIPK